ncbi:DUF2975 domain-containing protein [Fredinandcohnia sp. 179-A 10B2 NHS]|uniref:DUF2975 domain-containing protein n=1 Tax=Fredinandcohnia sp. 179-A 10B2 NHS TaxID=3235176 RepID=UPI0039A24C87
MKKIPTLILKFAIIIFGLTVLALSIYWLPWQANVLEQMYPEFAHLKYPLLIGIYLTALPFFFALYQGYRLLQLIDKNSAFSNLAVLALNRINVCAILISSLYVVGFIILNIEGAQNPGILLIGIIITFLSIVIATFAIVLKNICNKAIDIKAANDLLV